MSGLEVAGLVLGVLPLAIKALRTYKDIMADMKGVPSDLANLIGDLETEMLRLRTSCELLLEQIVPFEDIDDYLDNPLSARWQKSAVNNKLRNRLSDSYPKFEEKVRDIQAVGLDLQRKLRLREDMLDQLQVNRRKATILRVWKAKVGFTLKKKDYNDIITRLKSANTFIHGLANDSRVLGPSRRRQFHSKIIHLLRNLAKSLFDALRGAATTCHCPQPHQACLELVVRDLAHVGKDDAEDRLAREVPFHIVLTSMVSDKTLAGCDEPQKPPQFNVRWTSFRLQCGDFDNTPLSPPPTLTHATNSTASLACSESTLWTYPGDESEKGSTRTLSPSPSNTKRRLSSLFKGHKKTVTFESISTTTACLHVSSPHPHRVTIPDSPLLNLCQLTVNKGKGTTSIGREHCHGWIMDNTKGRRFGLYPPRWDDDIQPQQLPSPTQDNFQVRTSLTLRQVLNHNLRRESISHSGPPKLAFSTKLRIAQAISAGILQLHGTPWISNAILTLDDIVLLVGPDSTFELRPFISKPVSDSKTDTCTSLNMGGGGPVGNLPCVPANYTGGSRPFHPTVFSLGLLLIQLVLEKIDDKLDLTSALYDCDKSTRPLLDVKKASELEQFYTSELQNEVLQEAAFLCASAIDWCLQTWKTTKGLDDGTFCDDFNVEVVQRLEEAIQTSV
ncbi:hypothetical protein B0T20DRAFT_430215 [Sordaria brevicollis]|uniref:Protein kinase domain-containing protein n=1 Tax=Sordaria brevicollis TaxID=83679 RepID=A0AAE0PK55_SORBR|nr:hypothetical protein B0T20DRAFT_430215 [Sordaria brevicollis]